MHQRRLGQGVLEISEQINHDARVEHTRHHQLVEHALLHVACVHVVLHAGNDLEGDGEGNIDAGHNKRAQSTARLGARLDDVVRGNQNQAREKQTRALLSQALLQAHVQVLPDNLGRFHRLLYPQHVALEVVLLFHRVLPVQHGRDEPDGHGIQTLALRLLRVEDHEHADRLVVVLAQLLHLRAAVPALDLPVRQVAHLPDGLHSLHELRRFCQIFHQIFSGIVQGTIHLEILILNHLI